MDEPVDGARTFLAGGDAYDRWMGRYSQELAAPFAASAHLEGAERVLDVGSGPGALTGELARLVGARNVAAVDPSPGFVAACAARHPGAEVREARAEELPYPDGSFDAVFAQLVLSFVSDPEAVAREFRRVLRPGGLAAACSWDYVGGMGLLRAYWDAAVEVDPDAPDEAKTLRFGSRGEIGDLFVAAGFADVREFPLAVAAAYSGFDELWETVMLGIGPAGAHATGLPGDERARVRDAMFRRLGSPSGAFEVRAVANAATGRA